MIGGGAKTRQMRAPGSIYSLPVAYLHIAPALFSCFFHFALLMLFPAAMAWTAPPPAGQEGQAGT